MLDTIEERACQLAVYIIETGATVRATARHFGISKSTVHKDIVQRLPQYNPALFSQVRQSSVGFNISLDLVKRHPTIPLRSTPSIKYF